MITCPFCHTDHNHGISVCAGCNAEVVYGATGEERRQGMIMGGIAGLALVMYILDKLGFSPNLIAIAVAAGASAGIGFICVELLHAKDIRFFRRFMNT